MWQKYRVMTIGMKAPQLDILEYATFTPLHCNIIKRLAESHYPIHTHTHTHTYSAAMELILTRVFLTIASG